MRYYIENNLENFRLIFKLLWRLLWGEYRLIRVLVCFSFMSLAVQSAIAAKGPPPALVKVATAREEMLAPTTWVPGTVISRNDARLAAEVAGRLLKVAEVGDVFQKGDVIAKIENTSSRLLLAEAKVRVIREKSKLKYLEKEVTRLEELAKQNSAAKRQLDQALSDRDIAKSELDVAAVKVEQAQEELSKTAVRAPFPGVVTERTQRKGERVDRGDTIVRFVDTSVLEVQARVSYSTISHITRGSVLTLEIDSELVSGVVRTLVPVGDDRSRLYDIRLDVAGTKLSAGQILKVAVPTAAPRNALVIPRDALVMRRDGTAVFQVLDDSTAKRVAVKTGIANGNMIEIIGDIQAGQRVVTRGSERLRPKQKVKIIPEEPTKEEEEKGQGLTRGTQ